MKGIKYVLIPVVGFIYLILGGHWDRENKKLPSINEDDYADSSKIGKAIGLFSRIILMISIMCFGLAIIGSILIGGDDGLYIRISLGIVAVGFIGTAVAGILIK